MPFGVWAGETEENTETGGAPANQAEQTTELPEADDNGKITLTGANTSYTLTSKDVYKRQFLILYYNAHVGFGLLPLGIKCHVFFGQSIPVEIPC